MALNQLTCSKCGGELQFVNDKTLKCSFCKSIFHNDNIEKEKKALSELLDEQNQEKIANIRRTLWNKVNEEYIDSIEIQSLCKELKKYLPEDFYANFYYLASLDYNHGANETALCEFLDNIDTNERYDDVSSILDFMIKSITPRNRLSISKLIERAYKSTDLKLYEEYRTKYDTESNKLDNAVYDPFFPRNVFVCYSSKDMDTVTKLVNYLEDNGLTCFVALRNMQHGNGAAANYWDTIQTAIDNCEAIVFISSTNSRNINCDAKKELEYITKTDRNREKPIKRIEYIIENYEQKPIEKIFQRFFSGLEYCYTCENVLDRYFAMDFEPEPEVEEKPNEEISIVKEVKYCKFCGAENPKSTKYCCDCGEDSFVETRQEYLDARRQSKKELEEIREKAQREKEAGIKNNTILYVDDDNLDLYADATNHKKPKASQADDGYIDIYADAENRNRKSADVPEVNNDPRNKARGSNADTTVNKDLRNKAKGEVNINPNTPKEVIPLQIGQRVSIPKGIDSLIINTSLECKVDNIEPNMFIFMLGDNGNILSENDFVFYNNTSNLNGSIKLISNYDKSENIYINMARLDVDLNKISFVYTVSTLDNKTMNMSMLKQLSFAIKVGNSEYVYEVSNAGKSKSIYLFELYRYKNEWRIKIVGLPVSDTIEKICKNYGIQVN